MNSRYFLLFLFINFCQINAQNVFKTPTGIKYHLSSCRMVENVSKKIIVIDDYSNLEPCKICNPPVKENLISNLNSKNKAVGITTNSAQCKGVTQKGTRCKHKTKLANGYCYQHTEVNSKVSPKKTFLCSAKTKSDVKCKRKVKKGKRCYQHK